MVKIFVTKECELQLEKSKLKKVFKLHRALTYDELTLKNRRTILSQETSYSQRLVRSLTWSNDLTTKKQNNSPENYSQAKNSCLTSAEPELVLKTQTFSRKNCLFRIFKLFLYICVICFLLSFLLNKKSDCDFHSYIRQLEEALSTQVYGQHIAVSAVYDAISKYFNNLYNSKPLILSLHGWSGSGKTWISHVISNLFPSDNIHIFPLLTNFDDIRNLVSTTLGSEIFSDDFYLCPHIIVLDDMNKVNSNIILSFVHLLQHWNDISNSWSKTIILLLSSTGDIEISRFVFEERQMGRSRLSLTAEEIIPFLNNSKDVWYKPLLENQLIDAFIPFLPLEVDHVRLCIEYQLKKRGLPISTEIVNTVLSQINFVPQNNPLFSKSGCKKIATKVYLFVN